MTYAGDIKACNSIREETVGGFWDKTVVFVCVSSSERVFVHVEMERFPVLFNTAISVTRRKGICRQEGGFSHALWIAIVKPKFDAGNDSSSLKASCEGT